ncbi:unnamed protein product [Meloidogyne enterolobii]|uniref:Uncharacterized protein n=1 Tax=Meloidogyne enterolobii TaxID=390850 RepID=A0ACB0YRE0_MELEN
MGNNYKEKIKEFFNYFKRTCESTATDLWCMVVHSCFVEDGSGTEFQILTDEGCAIDRYLLDNLEYGPGPLQAQKEAHAFKFADRVVVNFQCSIRLDIRDGECPVNLIFKSIKQLFF